MSNVPLLDRESLLPVRQQLLDGVSMPAGAAHGIGASWARTRSLGLAPGLCAADAVLDAAALRALRAENERLIAFALPEVENLHQQIAGTNSAVLLADSQGVILERQGDPGFRERSRQVALSPGACWGESARGTNAIGLALAEGRSASVHGPEHYLECNTFLTCAAAPIHDPRGQILGLLDVSGDQPARQLHALGLVRMGARMIENRILLADFPDGVYVHFHARPELLGTLGEGIVAVDADGRILAMNEVARSHFGAVDQAMQFETLFDSSLEALLRVRSNSTRVRTTNGITVCVRLTRPRAKSPITAASAGRTAEHDFSELHAGDANVLHAARRASRVFNQGIPVLIEGETGSGKEWLAQSLHSQSPRSAGPLVTVNCAAIPEGLVESELFGHVPGAFTGANPKGAPGRILEADGGTLFLDEIGDMPLALQTRLLRVLQERTVLPVGGGVPREVDFTLISATNRDLGKMVESGDFRADLYYRICGLPVSLPALRDRDDLAGLIERFVAGEDPSAEITPSAWRCLLNHSWPGNLRELHNTLRTALALRDPGAPISEAELPDMLSAPQCAPTMVPEGTTMVDHQTGLRGAEERCMEEAIAAHGGNYSAAARALGISRSTLYRRLGRLR